MSILCKSFTFSQLQRVWRKSIRPCALSQKHGKNVVRLYCDKISDKDKTGHNNTEHNSGNNLTEASLSARYNIFKESDAPILLDVYEEKMQLENEALNIIDQDADEFTGLNLKRGVQGVFDIEDLVELLRRDRAEDIFVAALPPQINYVDYIVIVTGRSKKHISALAEIVQRVFKKKRFSSDVIPRIEGENSADWMALDLGNIALHIFSNGARQVYDLESLWSVGSEYDPLVNAPEDSLITMLKKHEISLSDVSNKGELL